MKHYTVILFVYSLLTITSIQIFAHLCHDPFRPQEHLVLVPEKESIELEDKLDFRIFVENTFSSKLESVQLFIENPAFEIDIDPPILKKLLPGERTFFLVKLKLREGFNIGYYHLKISVGAKSAQLRPSLEKMSVAVTKKPPELLPSEIKPETTIQPELLLQEPKPKILPEVPKEKKELERKEISPQEIKPEEIGEIEIPVEVKKIPFYKKSYFWAVLILPIVIIFIWRKLKR